MKRHATAHWSGNLADGKGSLTTQSGALSDHAYSFKARFEDESGTSGTNPEELLAAAHAGCFTMQLSHLLAETEHLPPIWIRNASCRSSRKRVADSKSRAAP